MKADWKKGVYLTDEKNGDRACCGTGQAYEVEAI
jgi:hypothetical protein